MPRPTRLLIVRRSQQTHNIALAGPIAEYVVAVSLDGHVRGEDSVASALKHDNKLAAEVSIEQEVSSADERVPATIETSEKANGKLVVEEEVELGHVGWPASKECLILVVIRVLKSF